MYGRTAARPVAFPGDNFYNGLPCPPFPGGNGLHLLSYRSSLPCHPADMKGTGKAAKDVDPNATPIVVSVPPGVLPSWVLRSVVGPSGERGKDKMDKVLEPFDRYERRDEVLLTPLQLAALLAIVLTSEPRLLITN
jgi:hypothetical protein